MEVLRNKSRSGNAIVMMAIALLVLPLLLGCRDTSRDSADIKNLIQATWNRPGEQVQVNPVAISGDYAVADWTQGEMGGRALLSKESGKWRVILCAGDALRDASMLKEFGVPSEDGKIIANKLAKMEADVPTHRLKAMSAFKGLMRMQ